MPVALDTILAANALVSLEEAKKHLLIARETNEDDLALEDQRIVVAINWMSDWVETNVRPMAQKTETLRLAAPRDHHILRLDRTPIDVTAPLTVSVAGTDQTVWIDDTDGERTAADVLVWSSVPGSRWCPDGLWSLNGWGGSGWRTVAGWSRCECGCGGGAGHISGDPQPIVVTYTGGYDCLPEDGSPNQLPYDVQHAALETVKAWFRNEQQGTTDLVSLAQPGGGPTFEPTPRWMPYVARQLFAAFYPQRIVS